jgi:hypothetical protein
MAGRGKIGRDVPLLQFHLYFRHISLGAGLMP